MDDFLFTKNFGMILAQPVHTNDNVKTTKFNRHENNFKRESMVMGGIFRIEAKDKDMKLLSALWCGSIGFDSFLPLILLWLIVIMAVVGIGVTVVVVAMGVVVESSSDVKLSLVVT
uniref:Transmembrane protein n=1 Tax=Tanacetum cinerariifolium TaxID=118510 RepID=A0A699Q4U8_TANCI|nr:hypothetical protein [Tanacetum cinerariifolium]